MSYKDTNDTSRKVYLVKRQTPVPGLKPRATIRDPVGVFQNLRPQAPSLSFTPSALKPTPEARRGTFYLLPLLTRDAGPGTRDVGRGTLDAGPGTRDAGRSTFYANYPILLKATVTYVLTARG